MAGEGDGPGERVELGEVYEQELVALPVAGDLPSAIQRRRVTRWRPV